MIEQTRPKVLDNFFIIRLFLNVLFYKPEKETPHNSSDGEHSVNGEQNYLAEKRDLEERGLLAVTLKPDDPVIVHNSRKVSNW
jgi:hypothetical protein